MTNASPYIRASAFVIDSDFGLRISAFTRFPCSVLRGYEHRVVGVDRQPTGHAGFVFVNVVLDDADVCGLLPIDVVVGEEDVLAAVFVVAGVVFLAAGGEVGGDGEGGVEAGAEAVAEFLGGLAGVGDRVAVAEVFAVVAEIGARRGVDCFVGLPLVRRCRGR
jgi:hypothetical protein